MQPLAIRSAQGDYQVRFGESVAAVAQQLAALPRAIVLVDRRVAELHALPLRPLLAAHPVLPVDATEEEKSWDGVGRVLSWMLAQRCDKGVRVVAVGGGIIQDIAALSAHLFHRGLKLSLVPTTLLAMSDSCIGAKSGVNFGPFKNQIGAFHSPVSVDVATDFLTTLTDNDIASGWGEILKLHLTGFPDALARLDAAAGAGGLRGPRLGALVRDSLVVKQAIIEEDEYERGRRVLLNYGHTFGHALESVTSHGVPHGLAVAWGMDLVNYIGLRLGRVPEAHFRAVHDFIKRHLPARHGLAADAGPLLEAVRRDKKAAAGSINLVLPAAAGSLETLRVPVDENLGDAVAAYMRETDVFGA